MLGPVLAHHPDRALSYESQDAQTKRNVTTNVVGHLTVHSEFGVHSGVRGRNRWRSGASPGDRRAGALTAHLSSAPTHLRQSLSHPPRRSPDLPLVHPSLLAIDAIAAHCDGCSGPCSRTIRIAPSRTKVRTRRRSGTSRPTSSDT